jgi:GT2 family glycosyltransferase
VSFASASSAATDTLPVPDTMGAPSLRVQVVLYHPSPGELARLARGASAAGRRARRDGVVSSVVLALGDSSPNALDEDVLEATGAFAEPGVDGFSYSHFGQNLGSGGGHNALFEECASDLVFVTNPDTYFAPNAFGPLVEQLADSAVGIAEARQLPLEHPKRYDTVTGDVSWASGACMMLRASTYRELGGFDADTFFLYCDDVDLSWRARLAGYRVVYVPRARVYHDKRLTGEATVEATASEGSSSAEAALLMAWKWSRPDLVTKWSRDLLATGDVDGANAVAAFEERRSKGRLPAPLDADGSVATFVGHDYSRSQFFYYD